MRVLLIPELYRPDDATANGTFEDLTTLAAAWLDRDPTLHVYWLLPPRERANYDRTDALADRERVTLLEAPPFMRDSPHADAFSETGYSEAEFRAIRDGIFDPGGYVDVVVDQRVTGRFDLFKWLLELSEYEAASVRPVRLVANVHDLRLPFKRHGAEYPNDAPPKVEMSAATYADRLWFKAGVDARRMREYGSRYFQEDLLDGMVEDAVRTGSPIEFDRFETAFADEPRRLHVSGSGWGKKNVDDVLAVGRRLYEDYGIETIMTNMDPIVDGFAEREFVDPYPEADEETYERALEAGDLTICASDHETMARTWVEQAASGQVLVARDRPWLYDCVPEDYRLAGSLDELEELAVRAVERWDDAVAETRRMLARVREVRCPERCGERTYEDLRAHVEERVREFDDADVTGAVERALEAFEDHRIALDELVAEADARADDGDEITRVDAAFALRTLGYEDAGTAGTPVFRPADD